MLLYTGTAYLHAATGKEEHLRIMGIIGKIQFDLLQVVQGRIWQFGAVQNKIPYIAG